jgi:hypothetical protein
VRLDDSDDVSTDSRGNVGADDEILLEFRKIALSVPKVNIGANINERFGRVADGITELLKFEDAVVDVVAVIHRNITVDGLGSPNFGRDFDHKSTRTRLRKRQRQSIIVVGIGVGIVADVFAGQERRKSIVASIGIRVGVVEERQRGAIK